MTTENQPTETPETSAELDEAQHARLMAEAELELLKGPALRETIRSAGFDPNSSAGKVLAELAATNESLRMSTGMMKAKASSLGLSANVAGQPTPSAPPPSELTDPDYPPTHSRNTPGTVEHDKALIQKAIRDPFRQAAERMLSPTTYEDDTPSPMRVAAEQVAAKWNPATPKPNPWRAQTTDKPPPTDAEQKANKEAFLAHRKATDKKLHDLTRSVVELRGS